jgi:hypothetical protein
MPWFFLAALVYLCAALTPSSWSLPLLLIANALVMTAICVQLGFVNASGFSRRVWQCAGTYLLLLCAHVAFVAIVLGYPLQWLWSESSLGAALAVSAASAIVLLGVWRLWPAFGLVFVCKPEHVPRSPGSHSDSTVVRSVGFAWVLTDENELFFSHGLIVAASLFVLTQGALSLAGFDAPIPARLYPFALAIYAVVIAPFAHWLIARRCAAALLIQLRRVRNDRAASAEPAEFVPVETPQQDFPAELNANELDAMLLRCVRAGQTQLALAALARGANLNCIPPANDRDQRSVLVLAAVNPDLRLLRGLIAKGVDLNHAHAGLPPLIAATRDSHDGRPDAVMTLLTNGADPRCTDAEGNTPLHFAVLALRPIVAALLCDGEAPLNAINREGLTPLGVACAAANWELVRFLLERGARIEVEHAQPAMLAAAAVVEDDDRGIKLLLKRKAQVDTRDALGRTALITAALHGHAAIAKTLLDAGAHINLADARGVTALMEATRSGAHAVLDVLAAHKPALDSVDSNGRSALMIASQSKQASEETVRRLLAFGASSGQVTADGRQAVDFAAAGGRWNIVAMLDPHYPLPATLAAAEPAVTVADDSPAHLLDALRFAHWNIVENFAERVRSWPQAEMARIFAELMTHSDSAPRCWLLSHGLDADAVLADGRCLLEHAFSQLPASLSAATDLLAACAQPGGGDGLVRVCHALDIAEPDVAEASRTALETLGVALLERGAEAFVADANGRNPLAHAVTAGSLVLTQSLLARGADPQARDEQGRAPLFAALRLPLAPALGLIQALLRDGADPETRAANGETPLGLALARPEPELQRWLNWPSWKLPARRLRPADLVSAAACGDVDAVDKLLALGLPIGHVDAQGATALVRAAGNGHAAMVAYLLDHGADAAQSAATGATALSAAVSAQQGEVVDVLLDHGVAVDQRLVGGGTALMIAAAFGHAGIAAQLLAHQADVDAEDERGTRALHAAAQFAFQSSDNLQAQRIFELLLEHGATIDARNSLGQTALLLLLGARADPGSRANQKQLLELLSPLIRRHADLNAQDQRGVSALHACAMHGLLLPARALLAAGADPERRDIREREIAHLLGFIDVAAELGATALMPGPDQSRRTPAR